MAANSETGVLNAVSEISERVHAVGALFHCDATQSVGRLPFDLQKAGADFLSMSSHKISGPAGVGALVGRGIASGGCGQSSTVEGTNGGYDQAP